MGTPTSHLDQLDGTDLLNQAIQAHYNDMIAAVGRGGHSESAAREVVHDLYLKLAMQPNVLKGTRSLRGFLCRAAINLGIDRFRRQQFETRLFSGTEEEATAVCASSDCPDTALDIRARLTVLKRAIAELPNRRRAAFVLHRLHHLSPDEIAVRLNISRNMVDRHLRRALSHCLDSLLEME